jgi:hypothetical protein
MGNIIRLPGDEQWQKSLNLQIRPQEPWYGVLPRITWKLCGTAMKRCSPNAGLERWESAVGIAAWVRAASILLAKGPKKGFAVRMPTQLSLAT